MTLTREAWDRARAFLLAKARPLERALFRYHFEGGAAGPALEALGAFQNPDGGFGRGLEPDFRLEASSAAATVEAFHVIFEVRAPASSALVRRAIGWVVERFDADAGAWPLVPPEVNAAPHAPWWHWDPGQPFGRTWGNPGAQLAAALHAYPEGVPDALLARVAAIALERLEAREEPVREFEARYYLKLSEHAPALRERLLERLLRDAPRAVAVEPEGWGRESFKPFCLVEGPDSPLAPALSDVVLRNLDWELGEQAASGAWEPNWTWFGHAWGCDCAEPARAEYERGWERAQREWWGRLTLEHLCAYRAFGRVEAG